MPVLRISSIQSDNISNNRQVYIDPTDYKEDLTKYIVNEGDLLIAMSGATTGKIGINRTGKKYLLNQRVGLFKPSERLNNYFLFLYLTTKIEDNLSISAGAAQPNLSTEQIKNFPIPLPPLPEQKRIVAILDEVFAGISTAVAIAEKNLSNARELFESHLSAVFSQKGDGWVEKSIADCFNVKSGDFLPKRAMNTSGSIVVYGGNGPAGMHDSYNLSGSNVLIGRVGAKCGNVRAVIGEIWLTDNAFYVSEHMTQFDDAFLAIMLRIVNLGATANQMAQPVISYKTISPIKLSFPKDLNIQRMIVERCNMLQSKTQGLESIYQQKLASLAELKQSILQKAFTGELTATNVKSII